MLLSTYVIHIPQIFTHFPNQGREKDKYFQVSKKYAYCPTNLCHSLAAANLQPIEARSNMQKNIFRARNCQATHWMIVSEFFLCSTQQVLK